MPVKSYLPTLRINDSEVPVAAFSFSAPAGNLGVRADVRLSDPTLEITRGDDFDLTLKIFTGTQPKTRLIKNGRVVATDKGIASKRLAGLTAPNDSLSIVGIDHIAERWKFAPRRPVILYNPDLVTIEESETDSNVNDADGNRIFAELVALESLDLKQILSFAYVERCGFSEVITNIPTYSIPRADFNLNSSYHAVAASFYSYFKPLVFEFDNRLFIIDVYGEIPVGVLSGARTVNVSKYLSYSRKQPEVSVVNAVLLTHRLAVSQTGDIDELPENVTQRTETETRDSGEVGADGWVRNQFTRYIAELHEDEEDEEKITGEIVWKVETLTTAKDENGIVRDLTVDTQTDIYSNSWRLKLGYNKSVQGYARAITGSALMQQLLTETNRIFWRPLPGKFGEYEKLFEETHTSGLVVIENEGEEDEVKTPLIEASRNNEVPQDGTATVENLNISKKTIVYRSTGADQIEMHVQKTDLLTGFPESVTTIEHVGTNAVRVRTGEAFNTKQVLLVDEDSDEADGGRAPISYDAGFVPYPIAKELALRALAEARTPRDTVRAELASFDAGIRRGSVRNLLDREGNSVKVIITGYDVTSKVVERGALAISQVIEGVVIG